MAIGSTVNNVRYLILSCTFHMVGMNGLPNDSSNHILNKAHFVCILQWAIDLAFVTIDPA